MRRHTLLRAAPALAAGLLGACSDLSPTNIENPNLIEVYEGHTLVANYLQTFNLLLVSTSGWKDLSKSGTSWLPAAPSVLILKSQNNKL